MQPQTERVTLTEHGSRLHISFRYNPDAIEVVKGLPGAKYCGYKRSWSVSVRYRKRIAEAVERVEAIFADEAEAKAATLKALDDEAARDPLPEVRGFRCYSRNGLWIISSPFSPGLVQSFKTIKGAKWNGSAWTFPSGAREELTAILAPLRESQIEKERALS
ncbi:hypothetical protein [Novosphingobium sp. MBES04]|uniref:hypothetical protein n=1 Tax=Novosphingobium sp. MBES04 TaxID=1206458 RepID=UPI001184CE99|nr:hypothetical protein [Novosphingobium sp. MBES04]